MKRREQHAEPSPGPAGCDLHRRRSVIVWMAENGERLGSVRLGGVPDHGARVGASHGSAASHETWPSRRHTDHMRHSQTRSKAGVELMLKRDDLIHPDFPGNKWRKLKYNLRAAQDAGHNVLLTFGGAYSNHIQATAAAGYYFGFSTIGVIRGERHVPLNPVLATAVHHGMTLTYADRTQYRAKTDPAFVDQLHRQFGDFYLIPEGSSNSDALRGCAELAAEINVPFDVLCCSSGTGATLAGVASALRPDQRAIGFSALKGGSFLRVDVARLQLDYGAVTHNWSIETEYHFGGFARRNATLNDFIADFDARHGITLDWVYEGKMMYGILDLVERGDIAAGTRLVAVLA
jgi:1-aminocyclopropane-1-carboxylate deaminase